MLNRYNPIAFIATDKVEQTTAFYRDLLGLEMIADEPFALVFNLNGTLLRIAKVNELHAAPYTVLGWEVGDIAGAVSQLTQRGVEFIFYPHMPQDDSGIWTTPTGVKVAWFSDPCGNVLSLTQAAVAL